MTAATPEELALTLDVRVQDLREATARLVLLAEDLKGGDLHAADHAEERIGWTVDAIRGTVRSLEYLKRFTVTGARRG